MDGFTLLQRLRADPRTRGVPAVAVSADALPDSVARGRQAGFADYLTKPVDLDRLAAVLRSVLSPG
jgi:CheY-like chemotaxis protein